MCIQNINSSFYNIYELKRKGHVLGVQPVEKVYIFLD
jgi:hypothetical protein